MKIKLLAVGTKMPAWVTQGYDEYARRMPSDMQLKLQELGLGFRGKGADLKRAIAKEGEQMLASIPAQDHVIALDVLGKSWSTEQLAKQMTGWRMEGQDVDLLVGGPDGLSPQCTQKATQKWSLSPLTLPHPLVRVLLAEQLYRAWTVNNNHPYHK